MQVISKSALHHTTRVIHEIHRNVLRYKANIECPLMVDLVIMAMPPFRSTQTKKKRAHIIARKKEKNKLAPSLYQPIFVLTNQFYTISLSCIQLIQSLGRTRKECSVLCHLIPCLYTYIKLISCIDTLMRPKNERSKCDTNA